MWIFSSSFTSPFFFSAEKRGKQKKIKLISISIKSNTRWRNEKGSGGYIICYMNARKLILKTIRRARWHSGKNIGVCDSVVVISDVRARTEQITSRFIVVSQFSGNVKTLIPTELFSFHYHIPLASCCFPSSSTLVT